MSTATGLENRDCPVVEQFKQALALIEEGHKNRALEICATIRFESDLGLRGHIVRKIANALIVALYDPKGFNCLSFAKVALRLTEDGQSSIEDEINALKEELATQLMLRFQQKKLRREAGMASKEKDDKKQSGLDQGDNLNNDDEL